MSKLRQDQLARQLQQVLAPAYLLSGDETLLMQESADVIRQAARDQGFSERELIHVDKSFDWGQLHELGNSLSLFGEKKLIELRITNGKPGDKGSKAICAYLENINPDNCLLIITPKLESASGRSKWVKALENKGHWLPIWPLGEAQVPRWIEQRLKAAGLVANRQCVDILAARTEGNLLAAHQEVEKLKLIVSDTVLTPEIVAAAVANSARYDVFGLVDKVLSGDARAALQNMQGLKHEGTDATVVLWALAREIRTLVTIHNKTAQGQAFTQAARQSGVWDKRQPLVQQTLNRLSLEHLEQLLLLANEADKGIKGLSKSKPWDTLTTLILDLAGKQTLKEHNALHTIF